MVTTASEGSGFRARYGPWAFVAGASDGIGECFARQLAARGLNLVLLARRAALLAELADSLAREHGVETRAVPADLTAADLDETVAAATGDVEVGLLVYNAGAVHGANKFLDQPARRALGLVDLNCRGPILLTHRFGSRMRERGRGGILLLTSVAALGGSSYTAAYNATKSFDLIFAESLWHELAPEGVDVTAAIVGATRTPSMLSSNEHFEHYPGAMEPADVAAEALASLGRGPSFAMGEINRMAARALSPVSRVATINGISGACAKLYDLPAVQVDGRDFTDEEA